MICMLHLMHSFFLKRRKFCSCSEKLCGSLYIFLILVPNFSFIILIYLLLVLSLIAIYQIDGYKILVHRTSNICRSYTGLGYSTFGNAMPTNKTGPLAFQIFQNTVIQSCLTFLTIHSIHKNYTILLNLIQNSMKN